MRAIHITNISTTRHEGVVVSIAQLDMVPTEEWSEAFDRSTDPAVFGHHPSLEGDRITVISESADWAVAAFAAREAVRLANARMRVQRAA